MKDRREDIDPTIWKAAGEIAEVASAGCEIVLRAASEASMAMTKLVDNIDSAGARTEALRAHDLYIGVVQSLEDVVIPRAKEMRGKLEQFGSSEVEADLLTDLWFAKTVRGIVEGVKEYEAEER